MRRLVALALVSLVAAPPARAGAAEAERLILEPATAATIISVEAHFPGESVACEAKRRRPLRARYRGRVEIARTPSGALEIVNELGFDDYLSGLAEVPPSWPAETLRAQAIAARTYALYSMAHPPRSYRERRLDICATDQCQVYRGAAVELGAFGERWRAAVEDTRGRALTRGGEPIQAFYFSTSAGRTRTNADVWGGEPLPYLPRVDAHDSASPLARWRVRVTLADLAAILRTAGSWTGGAITRVRNVEGRVHLEGGGESRTLTLAALRTALNDEAPCALPGRYPPQSSTGKRLPLSVPSRTYTVAQEGDAVVLMGRGWGHGVGMSQYGAKALGERGWSAARILAHFYRATLATAPEPERIRVLAAEGARRIGIRIEGAVRVTTATGSELAPGDRFEVRGGDHIDVRRGGPSLAPVLEITTSLAPATLGPGLGPLVAPFVVNRAARVVLRVLRGGAEVQAGAPVSFEAGEGSLTGPSYTFLPRLPGLPPGRYEVVLEATDGIDVVRTAPVALVIEEPAARPGAGGGDLRRFTVVAAALLAALVLAALARRRRRRSRSPS